MHYQNDYYKVWFTYMQETIQGLANNIEVKGVLSVVIAYVSTFMTWDWQLFIMWFILHFFDLIIKIKYAPKGTKENPFPKSRVITSWGAKTFTVVGTFLLISIAISSFEVALNNILPIDIVNLYIAVCIFTECIYIMESLQAQGIYIEPRIIRWFKRTLNKMEKTMDDASSFNDSRLHDNCKEKDKESIGKE